MADPQVPCSMGPAVHRPGAIMHVAIHSGVAVASQPQQAVAELEASDEDARPVGGIAGPVRWC
jgi:hypothetical protein